MVEIVFHEVIFGKIGDVGMLHSRDIAGLEQADIHLEDRDRKIRQTRTVLVCNAEELGR